MYENPLNFPLTRPDTSPLEDGDQYTGDNDSKGRLLILKSVM
jgi:hypothetical protein